MGVNLEPSPSGRESLPQMTQPVTMASTGLLGGAIEDAAFAVVLDPNQQFLQR